MEIINAGINLYDKYFVPSLIELGIALGIFMLFLISSSIITRMIFKVGDIFAKKSKTGLDDDMLIAFKKPVRVLVILLGLYIALIYLPFSKGTEDNITLLFRVSIIVLITWGLYNLAGTYEVLYDKLGTKLNFRSQKILKPFISKVIRIIIIAISIAIIAEEFGYSISAFVAGLGIGGIAIAMAAKDTLANVFGGIAILMDKPFDIGDWIVASGVEGVVENINFRSTKVRTFEKAIVSIPNSKMSEEAITNFSRRGIRRVRFYLGIVYSTSSDKIQMVVKKINDMLVEHPDVDNEIILSNFEVFNTSSLDILIQYYAKTSDYQEYLSVKENVNFKIMDILEEENVEVAFPSTSIYFEDNLNTNEHHKQS
ncbi:mechanosensitive ion channel family protein [Clostridium sp. D2Q-11]|uniref:Mechanosensitive ion channel family protein n=1 Tax=Anaeromonas frigoriresistens TaxID=2683708 RepID=A0A942UUK7_9FIRM|nr:mechanosensitive ion channel family protein [Anaeromonas frigoriresistens]MBS4538873.1 mechanosensitive ion channel family protein [Anaeromonas frigoriresistens]